MDQTWRQILEAQGIRMTPQRQLVVEAIGEEQGHFTADEIHARIRARFPQVHLTTVYRNLEMLEAVGLVVHTHFGESLTRYHVSDEQGPHHHLICHNCGAVTELADHGYDELFNAVATRIQHDQGFRANLSHFAISGVCARCATDGG